MIDSRFKITEEEFVRCQELSKLMMADPDIWDEYRSIAIAEDTTDNEHDFKSDEFQDYIVFIDKRVKTWLKRIDPTLVDHYNIFHHFHGLIYEAAIRIGD